MRVFSSSAFAILSGLGFGVITAIYALNSVGLKPVEGGQGWQEWRLGDNDHTLPYSLGHFLGNGQVPPPKAARFYVRERDDDGNVLSSNCVFEISGPSIPARWWSLSAGEKEASVLSAGQAMLDEAGNLKAVVSRHPLPGNWLTPPDSNSFTLTYIVTEPLKQKNDAKLVLPHVKKASC